MSRVLTNEEAAVLGINLELARTYIVPGGKLISVDWQYDDFAETGAYYAIDVSDILPQQLFETIAFSDDLKLKDIFLLVKDNIDFLEPVIGCWCREFIEEGLTDIVPYSGEYDQEGIEYLEVYNFLEVDTCNVGEKTLNGLSGVDFHGIGFLLKEDYEFYTAGTRVNWGLTAHANELADIPIKIDKTIKIHNDDAVSGIEYNCDDYNLITILRGIFWELSWYGPKCRQKKGP